MPSTRYQVREKIRALMDHQARKVMRPDARGPAWIRVEAPVWERIEGNVWRAAYEKVLEELEKEEPR